MVRVTHTPKILRDCFPIREEVKAWGKSTTLYSDNFSEVVLAEMVAGGYTSTHRHVAKDNHFTVLSGELAVWLTAEKGGSEFSFPVMMGRGKTLKVTAGTWHQAVAVNGPCRFLETYLPDQNNVFVLSSDIERRDVGGVRTDGSI